MKIFVVYLSGDHAINVFKFKSEAISYLEEAAGVYYYDDADGNIDELLDKVDGLLEEFEVK